MASRDITRPACCANKQQQLELIACEDFRFAVEFHLPRAGVDLQPAEMQQFRFRAARTAAQDRFQPRQQFARLERFGEIIVSADF